MTCEAKGSAVGTVRPHSKHAGPRHRDFWCHLACQLFLHALHVFRNHQFVKLRTSKIISLEKRHRFIFNAFAIALAHPLLF